MRNISAGCLSNRIHRTYDMKGSKYQREVLVKKNLKKNKDLSKVYLISKHILVFL